MTQATLSDEEKRRYARHLVLPDIGEAGQAKLKAAKVLVIGAGGLGAAAASYLAAMGVGTVGLVDDDRVELSNLQRQALYENGDIGRLKIEAAHDALEERNPHVTIQTHAVYVEESNAQKILGGYDIVLDGSDNFATRFTVHDVCYALRVPLVSAAISGFQSQLSTFKAYLGAPHPCYRCYIGVAPRRERTCEQEGIIGALAGMIGAQQALEAAREIIGITPSLSGHILFYDALAAEVRKVVLHKDKECELCSLPH